MYGGKINNNLYRSNPKEISQYPLNDFNEKPLHLLNNFKEETINIPKINIKDIKSNINNNNYTDADSLVEYFHGMLLNYISLEKNKGKLNDQSIKLMNIINDVNKQKLSNKIKINGGSTADYQYDIIISDKYTFYDDINIIYTYQYNEKQNYYEHNINIYSENNDDSETDLSSDMEIENLDNETNDSSNGMEIENNDKGFNLIIDFKKNEIYETTQKIKTKNIYESGVNINYLLEKIIEKMINLYNNEFKWSVCVNYNNNDDKEYKRKDKNIYQSILSLLIVILSFRNDMSKEIYAKYNYKRFLMEIQKNINKHKYLFAVNNDEIILSYDDVMTKIKIGNNISYKNKQINFRGDCALNVLTCVKNKDIQEMLIIKKNIIENNNYLRNNINYIKTIQKIIKKFNCDNDIKNSIMNYIKNFDTFIKKIEYNYNLFNNINFVQENTDDVNLDNYNIDFDKLKDDSELFITYGSTIFDILMDYNEDNYLINSIVCETKENNRHIMIVIRNAIERIKNNIYKMELMKNTIKKDKNIIKEHLLELKEIYSEYYNIITNKINTDLFYVNMIISLLLIIYKIDYLFDERIFEIFRHDDIKRYAMRRFSNISSHRNELDRIKFNYIRYNIHDYLFRYVATKDHALLLIMDVNNTNLRNKTYSICDLNDLNFITLNQNLNFDNVDLKFKEFYYFGETRFTSNYYKILKKEFKNNKLSIKITTETLNETYTACRNKKDDNMYRYIYCCFKGLKDMNKNFISLMNNKNEILKFPYQYEDEKNLSTIIKTTNIYDYEICLAINVNINNYFKINIYNILNKIFENYYKYDKIKQCLLLNIKQNILNDYKCINDNFPYYLIKELYNITKYKTKEESNNILNIHDEFKFYSDNINMGYDAFGTSNTKEYLKYLSNGNKIDKFYTYIYNTLIKYDCDAINLGVIFEDIDGGEQLKINDLSHNDLSHNNSIIKNILIVLLIVIIIIIIVLIVLLIINKYKNNNKFK